MKFIPIILSAIILSLLLTGCSQKPDTRVAQMQSKITALESNVTELRLYSREDQSSISNLVVLVHEMNADYRTRLETIRTLVLDSREKTEQAAKFLMQLTNRPPPRYAPAPVVSTARLTNGVPIAIYNQIFAEAQRRHPADYDTQKYIIQNQIEAYRTLHP